jgi:putative transposase
MRPSRWAFRPRGRRKEKPNNSRVIALLFLYSQKIQTQQMDRTFSITSITAQRRTIFQKDSTANLFIEVLLHYRAQRKYFLHEFVVIPDHFHVLITPFPQISLERAVQFIKGGFSYRLKSRFPIWQPSFTNHRIRDEDDFQSHVDYIRMNPVRARLVQCPEDYRFSSASGLYPLDPVPPGLKPNPETIRTPA